MSDTQIRRAIGVVAAGVALLATATVGAQQTGPGPVPTFAKDVAPLLYKNCGVATGPEKWGRCHS
jgi:hypothetical protein